MTNQEAKQILLLYRPGTADADDPEIAQAIDLARRDPELATWFQQHQAFQKVLRAKFRQIEVPEHLKALTHMRVASTSPGRVAVSSAPILVHPAVWRRTPVWLAAAAALILLLGLSTVWLRPHRLDRFVNYQQMMVSKALGGYNMECVASDMRQVRSYLQANGAPADYRLTPGLDKLRLLGSAALKWQNHPVAMVCFDQPDGQKVWLFVMDRSALKDPPPALAVETPVNILKTASWTEGDRIYLVAGPPQPGFKQKYL